MCTINSVWHLKPIYYTKTNPHIRIVSQHILASYHWTVICGLIYWRKQQSKQLFIFQQRRGVYVQEKNSVKSLSNSHPNWCMQVVWNTLKWRRYILYYKSIKNVIIITLYIFRLKSVFTTDYWLNIAFNVFHICIWCARGMNMNHF